MPRGIQQETKIQTPDTGFLGLDTASEPTSLSLARSRRLQNAFQGKLRAITKRPGSAPVTPALANPIKHLTYYQFAQSVPVGAAPALSAVAGSATLPTATYYVRRTYVTDYGETDASGESFQAITLGQILRIVNPSIPFHANSINIYISTTTNAETLRFNTTLTTFDLSAPLPVAGVAYPTINTTSFQGELLAASGTSLYSLYNGKLNPATMTDALKSADIYDTDIMNTALTSRKIIADGGSLKSYNGSAVANIPPAPNDASPAPPNVLVDVNAKGIKYVWNHNNYVFVSPGTNEVFYTKKNEFDYIPQTFYALLNRYGDTVNGPGVSFDDVCFIPMRRGWNIVIGQDASNFAFNQYLNTINGMVAPRSIVGKMTYPDGRQTVPYLSSDGVYEITNVAVDNKSRYYGTRSLMKDKIDWGAYGFTQAETSVAVAKYVVQWNMYLLQIKQAGIPYVFGYDTRNEEWYIWTGLTINSLLEWQGVVYFGGDDGALKKFDPTLYTDWTDMAKTMGTAVDIDRISGMIAFEETGYPSMLDYYILRLKQFAVKASLDISIIHMRGTIQVQQALKNNYMIWDVTAWDEAVWANLDYTDLVSAPQRLSNKLKLPRQGFYFQVRLRNNRDEPVEIYGESLIGRTSGEV